MTHQTDTEWLPLNLIRGQTTHIPTNDALATLHVSICDKGYLPPARGGVHCAGSSFGPGDTDTDERPEEHTHNIGMMKAALPDLTLTEPTAGWQGHVAHRCNSNDYLPVAGVVPDLPAFNAAYDRLRHDRNRLIDEPCPTLNGLGVLTSLGSRGLSAAPLAAEVLADQLLGHIPAVPRYLQRHCTGALRRARTEARRVSVMRSFQPSVNLAVSRRVSQRRRPWWRHFIACRTAYCAAQLIALIGICALSPVTNAAELPLRKLKRTTGQC